MILKLNDLQRSLDQSLATTHGAVSFSSFLFLLHIYHLTRLSTPSQPPAQSRIYIIVARFCAFTAWQDDKTILSRRFGKEGFSVRLVGEWFECWWQYQKYFK